MQMTLRQFIKNYSEIVAQTNMSSALKLQKGQCGDMEQYHRNVGRAEGLEQSVSLMREMLGQLEAADQDSDLPEMDPPGGDAK